MGLGVDRIAQNPTHPRPKQKMKPKSLVIWPIWHYHQNISKTRLNLSSHGFCSLQTLEEAPKPRCKCIPNQILLQSKAHCQHKKSLLKNQSSWGPFSQCRPSSWPMGSRRRKSQLLWAPADRSRPPGPEAIQACPWCEWIWAKRSPFGCW